MESQRWTPELSPVWRERLGERIVTRFEAVADHPRGLLDAIRGDSELGLALLQVDTVEGLSQWFQPEGQEWVGESERSGALGEESFAATWTFEGRHVSGGRSGSPLAALPATGREVIVRGVTILGVDSISNDRVEVRRYVDWAGVFAHLGLTLNWRVPLSMQTAG